MTGPSGWTMGGSSWPVQGLDSEGSGYLIRSTRPRLREGC